ncbi:hypothetical protein [Hymenobacter algoricola]|uniref:Uncharacterized protein n=1 Tax=Hymenobacter algoricola TaxID=486267 RepID=A0ABP7NUA2_9BACT
METLDVHGKRYQVPGTWNEVTRLQLLDVLRILYGPESTWPQKLRLLSVLSGVNLSVLLELPAVQCVQLYDLTDFVFDEEQCLTQQLLPVLMLPARHDKARTKWVGPRSEFRNLLFGEFIFADTYFRAWATHQSAEALHLFLAVLYRAQVPGLSPRDPRWQGDQREAFNEHRLEHFASKLCHLDDATKLAVATWYRGCRRQLEQEFPEVFDVHETDAGGSQQAGDWGRVLRKLSGGAFGPVDTTARQNVRVLLAEMQDAARDYQKALKNAK